MVQQPEPSNFVNILLSKKRPITFWTVWGQPQTHSTCFEKVGVIIWHNLARDRPQAFSGAQRGINKNLTISLLNSWAKQADHLQEQIDNNSIAPPDSFADPRPRQKILRLLLTAGLLNPEANHRHRKLKGTIKCKCGASPTHHHITWDCPLFQEYRLPALQALTKPIEDFPVCFQYCTLVPMNMEITKKASSYHSG